MASHTYPSGRTITYAYNRAASALSAVDTSNGINYATNASYPPQGALASLQNGANLVSTFYYNPRLQPCRISVKSSGAALQSLRHAHPQESVPCRRRKEPVFVPGANARRLRGGEEGRWNHVLPGDGVISRCSPPLPSARGIRLCAGCWRPA